MKNAGTQLIGIGRGNWIASQLSMHTAETSIPVSSNFWQIQNVPDTTH
jgi:hypothetical protein